ncbi:Elongation factor P--(R)-beta-lysine ligase [Candidatus Venteria ishoeyi]|uniref:Elongation factor P--(R)-beta-lysine ligase n=2 Tax=Candidatus Venteria ishoeyi TaxID=1899563 RepID=A0A1H6FDM3_9GAMM|nr:Elongation factor P--(R)-beta-lysine ligase [Candidatus Venteria ishoeyi]
MIMSDSDWQPGANRERLQARANLLSKIRDFFAQRDVLEVETPVLFRACVPDPAIEPLLTQYHGPQPGTLYLQSSPELAMKRLLSAGSGAIYQISRVFRDGEAGRLHNPEFSLLEWYRPGFDHWQLMQEVDALLQVTLNTPPATYLSYIDAFLHYAKLHPLDTPLQQLQQRAEQWLTPVQAQSLDRDDCLNLILSHAIEQYLGVQAPLFLYDYPASQASLARKLPDRPELAARFELYMQGVELANGFFELNNAKEQAQRFKEELAQRKQRGLLQPVQDERFLAALEAGLPDCAGVALGLDRLLMLQTGAQHIDEVLSFSIQRV